MGPAQLATGVPLDWFGSQRRAFKGVLTGYGAIVQPPGQPPQRLWFESVKTLPQGVAAAVVVLANPSYRPGPHVVIVIDVGYRTTEYLVVTKGADGRLACDVTQAGIGRNGYPGHCRRDGVGPRTGAMGNCSINGWQTRRVLRTKQKFHIIFLA